MNYAKKRDTRIKSFKTYYRDNKESRCVYRRNKNILAEPKLAIKEQYLKEIQFNLLDDYIAWVELFKTYKKEHVDLAKRMSKGMSKAIWKIAAKKILNKTLQMRKEHVGSLLKAIRLIKRPDIKVKEDFGEGCHTTSSEPYYYDEAYQLIKRDTAIPVNHNGKCVVAEVISKSDNETNTKNHPMKWECCSECKVPTKLEVDAILALKEAFQKPMNDILNTFRTCDDGCPNQHYTKVVSKEYDSDTCLFIDLKGHPLVCYDNDTQCRSKLRILRAVSTHYPVLRNFLHGLYSCMKSHMYVSTIDNALSTGDFHSLMEITNLEFHNLFSINVEEKYDEHTETVAAGSMLRNPNLESHLLTTYAKLMIDLDKEIDDYPEHVCCSCERVHQRKSVTIVSLSDNLGSEVWPRLSLYRRMLQICNI